MITISDDGARALLAICRQVVLPTAESKLKVGAAQMELEMGLEATKNEGKAE